MADSRYCLAGCDNAALARESGCSRCHGTGTEPGYHALCPACGGSGDTAAPWCPICHGDTTCDHLGPLRCPACREDR